MGIQMARKERLSIDIQDIRDRVEDCRNTAAWREMSLSQKLRVLIIERLEQIEKEKEPEQQ